MNKKVNFILEMKITVIESTIDVIDARIDTMIARRSIMPDTKLFQNVLISPVTLKLG